jgi:hypothetical protein
MSDPNESDSHEALTLDSSRTDIEKAIELWEHIGNLLRELSDTASLSAGGIANPFFRIEELLSVTRRILIGNEEIVTRSTLCYISVDLPIPHHETDPHSAAALNIQFRQEMTKWRKLPWWKRLLTKRPEPSKGI